MSTIVDKLTPHPPLAEGSGEKPPKPKAPLTAEEQALFDRARNFVAVALKRHGIGPTPQEIQWLGAEVADFVLAEMAREPEEEKEEKPKRKFRDE